MHLGCLTDACVCMSPLSEDVMCMELSITDGAGYSEPYFSDTQSSFVAP